MAIQFHPPRSEVLVEGISHPTLLSVRALCNSVLAPKLLAQKPTNPTFSEQNLYVKRCLIPSQVPMDISPESYFGTGSHG